MLLIFNIKELLQTDKVNNFKSGIKMKYLPKIENAFVLIENEKISIYGKMNSEEYRKIEANDRITEKIDASNRIVMPAFCDSHSHIVFAGSREMEFVDKIKGLSYEEIARRGGGILNSAQLLDKTSEDDLYEQSLRRANEVIKLGTGAIEIKSGYGLTVESELKMLRVIKRLKDTTPLTIRATFLGAHSIPLGYRDKQQKYVDIVINEMIPRVGEGQLADYIDVFCDRGFFTVDETDRILKAGAKYGLLPKIHANELDFSGGIQVGVENNALSVDHLECVGDKEIEVLLNSTTMPTLLPGAAFFLNMKYPPARKMLDAGLPLALASDYNPGSSPSGNMQLVMSLAAIKLKMLPEEIFNAVTINSAYAMGVNKQLGTIEVGKKANLIITNKIPSFEFMPYSFGSNLVSTVILNGTVK